MKSQMRGLLGAGKRLFWNFEPGRLDLDNAGY